MRKKHGNLKDIPIDGVKIVPCRVNGPRGIVKSFLVTGEERLILVDTEFSDADADIIMDAIKDMGHKHEELKLCVLTHPPWRSHRRAQEAQEDTQV
jgi:hypothetical protein